MEGKIVAAIATLTLFGCAAAPPIAASAPEAVAMIPENEILGHAPARPATIIPGDRTATPEVMVRFEEAMADAVARQRVFDDPAMSLSLKGSFTQGGVIFGQTLPDAEATLDGEPVMVSADGRFVLGFGRDCAATALLVVRHVDGSVVRRALEIADRDFPIDRVDGLDQSKVSGFTEEQLERIAADKAKKDAARLSTDASPYWSAGFSWPVTGRISGVFGSQRILNGETKTPHSGVDVAAPEGTPVKAPAAGIVRLAEADLYFEGGLVLIDHGQWLESAFLHLSRIDVTPGTRVAAGDVIGAVGATGRATGPHMHWSVRWTSTLVDPALIAGEMPETTVAGEGDEHPSR